MPRTARSIVGGYAYHVLNRANGRLRLFKKQADFLAFEQLLAEIYERVPLRILGDALMANHWHFVVWPRYGQDKQVTVWQRNLATKDGQEDGPGIHPPSPRPTEETSAGVKDTTHLLVRMCYVPVNSSRCGEPLSQNRSKFGVVKMGCLQRGVDVCL